MDMLKLQALYVLLSLSTTFPPAPSPPVSLSCGLGIRRKSRWLINWRKVKLQLKGEQKEIDRLQSFNIIVKLSSYCKSEESWFFRLY